MRADGFAGQLIQALSRRTPAFQPGPGKIGSFGHEIMTALGRSGPAFLPQHEPDASRLSEAADVGSPMTRDEVLGALRDGMSLVGVDLRRVDLSRVDLSRVDLRSADLRGADLSRADLRGAILHGADLSRADLSRADLRGSRWDSRTSWPKERAAGIREVSDEQPDGSFRVRGGASGERSPTHAPVG